MNVFLRCGSRVASAVMLAVGLVLSAGHCAELPWTNGPYAYYADKTPITKVIQDFCGVMGIRAQIDADVSGSVSGKLNGTSGQEFLDRFMANHGLTWYYYGGILYVSRKTSHTTKTFPISQSNIGGLKQALTELGVLDARFGWAEIAQQGMVIVSGPPGYINIVAKTISSLPLSPSGQQVFVFRLKHASVEDRTIFYRDKQRTVLGIATILKNLVGAQDRRSARPSPTTDQPVPNGGLAAVPTPLPGALSGLLSSPLPPPVGVGAGDPNSYKEPIAQRPNATANSGDSSNRSTFEAGIQASIEADTRLNAIIVKDAPERYSMYEKLIAMLDVPAAMVEIEARIIDVNKKKLSELGFDWGISAGNTSFNFGDPNRPPSNADLSLGINARVASNTVVLNAGSYLLTRIKALETLGDANIIARPSILTTDNLSAIIDLSQTFYASVSGERVANLVPVTVGTMLKVTPHLIDEGGERKIQMVVDIEDGALINRPGLSLPVVQKSTLATQAVILENQSLLIGGYSSQSMANSQQRVPLLSDIPVVGNLFTSNKKDHEEQDRLFLITPRIIDPVTLAKASNLIGPQAEPKPQSNPSAPIEQPPATLAPASKSNPPFKRDWPAQTVFAPKQKYKCINRAPTIFNS